MADAIITTEMACCTCKVAKPLDQFSKSKTGRFGRRLRCRQCRSAENKKWRDKNPDYRMAYYENNKDKELAHPKSESRKATKRAFYKTHKARLDAKTMVWVRANAARVTARVRRRFALQRQATALWADDELILEFYKDAKRRTLESGVSWHVDHIVPLISKVVCGLHVQQNLRVITAVENISKSNQHWPDMP